MGDLVVAIGKPLGLGQTVTSGIVSALGRRGVGAGRFEDFSQTAAPIHPGNAGGALVNTKGELVGINTAIIAPAGGNVGIGFAVPADMARAVMDQLIRYGEVRRGRIGVAVQDLDPDLDPGMVITAVDGTPVDKARALANAIGLEERGERVTLTVDDGERRRRITLAIGDPAVSASAIAEASPALAEANGLWFLIFCAASAASCSLARKTRADGGNDVRCSTPCRLTPHDDRCPRSVPSGRHNRSGDRARFLVRRSETASTRRRANGSVIAPAAALV